MTIRDRALAWLVTGPVGRLYAFLADLAVYVSRAAVRRFRR
ncbi:MAG: hypothetical protein ACJ75R_02795 [Solirubrobacterales bacterium]